MKIERINTKKIKVTFTPEDLIEHNLSPEAVKNNSPNVQQTLFSIVRRAEEETGFEATDCRLMVEAMPGGDDTMVMYITRLDGDDDLQDAMSAIKRKIRLKVKQSVQPNKVCISFYDFEDAVLLAKNSDCTEECSLYFYEGGYHLVASSSLPVFFSEFGRVSTDEKLCDIVAEHGKLISKNALVDLKKHFLG